jgi:hypothetical protein
VIAALRRTLVPFALLVGLTRCAADPTGIYVTLRVTAPNIAQVFIQTYDGANAAAMPMEAMGTSPISVSAGGVYTFVVRRTGLYRRVGIQAIGISAMPPDAGVLPIRLMPPRPMDTTDFAYDRAIVDYVDGQMLEVALNVRAPCRTATTMMVVDRLCPIQEHCSTAAPPACIDALVRNPPRHDW